jgi:hypothetical protein
MFTWFLVVFLASGPQTVAGFRDQGFCEGVRAALDVTEDGKPVRAACVKGGGA